MALLSLLFVCLLFLKGGALRFLLGCYRALLGLYKAVR